MKTTDRKFHSSFRIGNTLDNFFPVNFSQHQKQKVREVMAKETEEISEGAILSSLIGS